MPTITPEELEKRKWIKEVRSDGWISYKRPWNANIYWEILFGHGAIGSITLVVQDIVMELTEELSLETLTKIRRALRGRTCKQ